MDAAPIQQAPRGGGGRLLARGPALPLRGAEATEIRWRMATETSAAPDGARTLLPARVISHGADWRPDVPYPAGPPRYAASRTGSVVGRPPATRCTLVRNLHGPWDPRLPGRAIASGSRPARRACRLRPAGERPGRGAGSAGQGDTYRNASFAQAGTTLRIAVRLR